MIDMIYNLVEDNIPMVIKHIYLKHTVPPTKNYIDEGEQLLLSISPSNYLIELWGLKK